MKIDSSYYLIIPVKRKKDRKPLGVRAGSTLEQAEALIESWKEGAEPGDKRKYGIYRIIQIKEFIKRV